MALTRMQMAGWGLADLGVANFVIVKQLLVLTFLTQYLAVPVGIAGAATFAVLAFDLVTDPLIGHLSDRTRGPWGRRAPWMAPGALVLAGGILLTFSVPPDLGEGARVAWVTGFFALATVGFTMVAIPYGAMAGEITGDRAERSTMTAWRMAFASVGLLTAGAVMPAIAGGTREGHVVAAMAVAPVIVGAIWGSLWLTRKAPRREAAREAPGLRAALALALSNRAFFVLVLLYGLMTLAIALMTAGLAFAALYLVDVSRPTALNPLVGALGTLSVLLAAFVLGAILSQPLWVAASSRLGKVGALTLGLVLYVVLLIVIWASLPSQNVTSLAGLFVLAGLTNGAYQQIPWAIYPDLMDSTRSHDGVAIEGAFSALWLLGQKAANAVGPPLLAGLLALYGWQESTGAVVAQSEAALGALRWGLTLLPAALLAVSVGLLLAVYRPLERQALGD